MIHMQGIRSHTLVLVLMTAVLLGCGGGSVPAPPASAPAAAKAQAGSGLATMVEGRVEIQATAGGEWAPLAVRTPIPVGAKVRTGDDGSCDLLLVEEGAIRLKPNTAVTVLANRVEGGGAQRIEIELSSGRLLNRFDRLAPNSEYRVTTPTAGAVIRGTKFEVTAEPDAMNVRVLAGMVEMGNDKGSVRIGEKQGATARAGQAPMTPQALVRRELDALNECSLLNFVVLLQRVHRVATVAQMANLTPTIEAWAAAHDGKYPATLAEAGLGQSTDDWNSPYRYEVRNGGTAYTIWSNGPDHNPDTEDDLEYRRD